MSSSCRPFVVLCLALLASVPAFAQRLPPRADRPYLGLFGGNPERPRTSQELNFGMTLTGAYDDNALADRGSQGFSPMFQESGGYAGAELTVDYAKNAERGNFNVVGGTSYRYYPRLSDLTGFNNWGSVGFSYRFNERTSINATETVSYSPYYNYGYFPGLAPSVPGQPASGNLDNPIQDRPAVFYHSTASFDRRVSRRATFTADYFIAYTDFLNEGEVPFKDWAAGGRFSYKVSRNLSAKLGYHYRENSYIYGGYRLPNQPYHNHEIDAGFDYARSIKLTRRTAFSFGTGSTIYRAYLADGSGVYNPSLYGTRAYVTANASLNSEIGRTWLGRINYQRGVDYLPGFPNALLHDSVTGELVGLASRRTRLSFLGGYTHGAMGSYSPGQRYDTYMATANLQIAVSSSAAFFTQYAFYHYRFDDKILLPPGMPRGQDRNSFTVGVTLWAPVIHAGHTAGGSGR